MTNQAILSLLNYLCNEARNSVHATFGLMELCREKSPDPAWRLSLDQSRSSADRLLRSIDDLRELLSEETEISEVPEEFDVMLCLNQTIELLNLAACEVAGLPAAPGAAERRHWAGLWLALQSP